MPPKTKIAFLDLTGCSGCEVNLLRTDSTFLDLAQDFEITNWRMLQEEKAADYDVVFVEGYACNEEQVQLLREVRDTCEVVVALGACAISGNIFSQLKPDKYEQFNTMVYSEGHRTVTSFVQPVPKVIRVDHLVPGCPVDVDAAKKLFQKLKSRPVSSRIKEVRPPDFVARIEGHGSLQVDFQEGTARFHPEEGERFIEALVVGKPYLSAPAIHSRICGICPVSHVLCSIKAIEKALAIRPRSLTGRLRRLFQCGQMVQSHLLHLYFMVLPAASGMGSSIEMSLHYPAEFHLCLNIKRVTEDIFSLIGGAPLHPVALTVGGFSGTPRRDSLYALKDRIADVLDEAFDIVSLVSGLEWPETVTDAHMLCVQPELGNTYPLFGSRIYFDGPDPFPADRYSEFIREAIMEEQPSKIGWLVPEKPIKTGSLARLSRYADKLNPLAQRAFAMVSLDFSNPFHNNMAQAVEILHYLEEALILLDDLVGENLDEALVDRREVRKKALSPDRKLPWPRSGVSVIEAPRGLLIHEVSIDDNGEVLSYNIVPPTVLNLSSLGCEADLLLRKYQTVPEHEKKNLLEELIRAMDPCITCAVH